MISMLNAACGCASIPGITDGCGRSFGTKAIGIDFLDLDADQRGVGLSQQGRYLHCPVLLTVHQLAPPPCLSNGHSAAPRKVEVLARGTSLGRLCNYFSRFLNIVRVVHNDAVRIQKINRIHMRV